MGKPPANRTKKSNICFMRKGIRPCILALFILTIISHFIAPVVSKQVSESVLTS